MNFLNANTFYYTRCAATETAHKPINVNIIFCLLRETVVMGKDGLVISSKKSLTYSSAAGKARQVVIENYLLSSSIQKPGPEYR
jgi:hypothetical protein